MGSMGSKVASKRHEVSTDGTREVNFEGQNPFGGLCILAREIRKHTKRGFLENISKYTDNVKIIPLTRLAKLQINYKTNVKKIHPAYAGKLQLHIN